MKKRVDNWQKKVFIWALLITLIASMGIKQYTISDMGKSSLEIDSLSADGVFGATENHYTDLAVDSGSRDYWVWFLGGSWLTIALFFALSMIFDPRRKKSS